MTHDRPDPFAEPGRHRPIWGPSMWERSARLPGVVSTGHAVRRPEARPRPVPVALGLRVQGLVASLLTRAVRRGDRGDVPGWVLVTLMTAGLVLVLWGIARDRLTEVFNHAIDSVLSGH